MPTSCCVPGCKSNYNSKPPRVSAFQFPNDKLLKLKWLSAIHRADFVPRKRSVVCIKHFDERFVVREDSVKRPDGSILTLKRDHLKLTKDAFPTYFVNLSKELPTLRKNPAIKQDKFEKRLERKHAQDKEDWLKDFDDLKCNLGSTSSLPPEKQRKLVTRKHPKTPPGPKNAPEELLELTFIKEEPSTSDNEVAHYEPTFVDVSAPSTIEDGPFIKSEPPETITAESPDETFSKYSEPTCTQSPPEVQSCMTSKTNSASKTSLRPSESALEPPPLVLLSKSSPQASISGKSTEQRNLKKKRSLQDANDRNETLPIFQTDVPEAEVRVRVAELQVEQMKKEYEAKMKNQQIIAEQFKKEHEAKMKEHEAKMKEHELKMKKVKGQIVEMEFRCQEMMKQSVIENKVHELTVMDLEQKLSTNQIIHELTIQELKQKLYNSQLEQQILEKRLNAHPS